jgi:hypothetical protein
MRIVGWTWAMARLGKKRLRHSVKVPPNYVMLPKRRIRVTNNNNTVRTTIDALSATTITLLCQGSIIMIVDISNSTRSLYMVTRAWK